MASTGLVWRAVAACFEYGNEVSVSIKDTEYLYYLENCQFFINQLLIKPVRFYLFWFCT